VSCGPRTHRRARPLAAGLLPGMVALCAGAGELPDAPSGVRASTVLAGQLDGRPASIRHLRAAGGCTALLQGFDAHWRRASPVPEALAPRLQATAGGWQLLSRLGADGLHVLQVRPLPGGDCEGLLTHWQRNALEAADRRPRSPVADARAPLPGWPAALRVLHRTESRDTGSRALTVLARAPLTPESTRAAIAGALAPLGLRLAPLAPERPASRRTAHSGSGTAFAAEGPRLKAALYLEAGDGFTDIVLMLQGDWS
jgi:hypothetical protein